MINLTTNITITNSIPSIRKWEVLDVRDNARDSPPSLAILIQAYGAGSVPYGQYWLFAIDGQASTGLAVNGTPQGTQDQLVSTVGTLAGTPYTTIAAAFNNSGASRSARLKNVENVLVSSGLVSAAFSGT